MGHSQACVTSHLLRAHTKVTLDDSWWHVMTCDDTLSVLRSMAATVPEQSQLLGPMMAGDQDQETQETALAWSRLPGQACRIPSHLLTSLESGARWGVDSTMHYGNLGGHHLQHFYYGLRAISRTQWDFPKCNLGVNMLPVLGSNGKPLKWLRKRLKLASTQCQSNPPKIPIVQCVQCVPSKEDSGAEAELRCQAISSSPFLCPLCLKHTV